MSPLRVVLLASFVIIVFTVSASATSEDLYLYGWEKQDAPPEVGDYSRQTSWNQTSVATETLEVSIGGQSTGFNPQNPTILRGTTVTWTNDDTMTHTVTDRDSQFDSFDIAPGSSWSNEFNEVGSYSYFCKYHPMMEGTITVVSDEFFSSTIRSDFIDVWTAESNLIFWANFSMSHEDTLGVYVKEKAECPVGDWCGQRINLTDANGFSIINLSNGTVMGDNLSGNTEGEWHKYQIHLDSQKLGYLGLDYNPSRDNSYAFAFEVRGLEGFTAIGGVQLVRTLEHGFFFDKSSDDQLTYEIFPSTEVEIDYFAKNIGTLNNTFRMTSQVKAQGDNKEFYFDTSIEVLMNGNSFESITEFQNSDGTWTYEFDMSPDDEALITLRLRAPDYNQAEGEPASNRKFDVLVNGYDVGSDESLRDPVLAVLFIKPSQFVLGEISFNRYPVLEGDSLEITAQVWNEGNYASDVLVVFYIIDDEGSLYPTPDGNQRMTRVASTIEPVMAPKPVLESQGIYQTWYPITAVWEEAFIPGETTQDFTNVEIYAIVNPLPLEQIDIDAGFKHIDEYLNIKDDNSGFGTIAIVKGKTQDVNCYMVDPPYPISLQSVFFLPYDEPKEPCSLDFDFGMSMIASEDGSGVWTVQIVKSSPQVSVNLVHWYLLDPQGGTKSDGLASDVYGYYSGQGKAVVFIDNDFNGKLSPGDKFEVHPGEAGSDLESVSDVSDFAFRMKFEPTGDVIGYDISLQS